MVDSEFSEQLKRLGLSRGAGGIKTRHQKTGQTIEELIPGQVADTSQGPFFLYSEQFEPDYCHGYHSLGSLLSYPPNRAAQLARDERLAQVDFRRMAFVDTETTGLSGGSGTYAFLVGVGLFEGERFTIHQFFMRDYHEEPALLHGLGELLDDLDAVVSFNGKSFDMPLLETRFIMSRQMPRLMDAPHLDLLPAARRFWKYRLDSCALSSLETNILGVERTQTDVPGWLIPGLYMDYARSGDAREMPRIFYHNTQDILSMVTLAAQMCNLLITLPSADEVPGEDIYGLARFLQDLGLPDQAEIAFLQSTETCQTPEIQELAMRDLAFLLKRQDRGEEALPWWQRLVNARGAIYACEELAKHYEWHEEDLSQAKTWTQQGIELAKGWDPGLKRRESLADLEHRLERLNRKQNCQAPPGDEQTNV